MILKASVQNAPEIIRLLGSLDLPHVIVCCVQAESRFSWRHMQLRQIKAYSILRMSGSGISLRWEVQIDACCSDAVYM